MAKQATSFTLALRPREPGAAAARWLVLAVRDEILEGRLRPGARLPSTRDLARQYDLSRGTVVSAFDQLRAEGYIAGATGAGTFVNEVLPDDLLRVPREPTARDLMLVDLIIQTAALVIDREQAQLALQNLATMPISATTQSVGAPAA